MGVIYELGRFHLKRAVTQALNDELVSEVYRACTRGEVDKVDTLLAQFQRKAPGDEAKEVARLRGYLMENAFGLRDYRLEVASEGLRGIGAIEGNVDKLVANRMKKRGMSWTIKGAQRMARLISLREMGQIHHWITHKDKSEERSLSRKEISKGKVTKWKDTGAWLKAEMPVLYGPHQNRYWVKMLRALTCQTLGI